ncbi:hypothetical protein LPTSP3_g02120 [Leptospira kobayashii]|uniref:Uncharacterized protein n=1 Tax=Leptospira kobayashii TaxID=1917830 RepID=A0ABM7UQE3_9LEPT|nr:hypothetical protein [Leptospira kobayashii]BDA77282.1 hypothetical protein LPTSP3_g02120 [Leptospira kobayashii]
MSDTQPKTELLKRQADMMGLTMDAVFTDEQAKEVLQGKITDSYLIKLKLDIDNKNGMLLILVSSIRKHIMEIYSVVGTSQIFRRIRTFADYVQISQDLADIGKSGGMDLALSENVGRALHRIFTKETLDEFLPLWQKKDPSRLPDLIEPAIINATKATRVKIQAEIDKLSSAKFRYENPMKGTINPVAKPEDDAPPAAPEAVDPTAVPAGAVRSGDMTPIDRQMEQFRAGFGKELRMKTVISPISGVDFDDLMEGQEILFRVPLDTAEGMTNANLLGLIDEDGNVAKAPIVGKFLGIASSKNEYHIFAEGPNNYLFHSIEEHPVKVAIPKIAGAASSTKQKSGGAKKKQESSGGGTLYTLIGIFAAIILIGFLIFVMVIL